MEGGAGVRKEVGNVWEKSIDVEEGVDRGENGSCGLRSRSEGSGGKLGAADRKQTQGNNYLSGITTS